MRIDVQLVGDDLALIERVPSLLARCCGARTQSLSATRTRAGLWLDDETGRLVGDDVAAASADAEDR